MFKIKIVAMMLFAASLAFGTAVITNEDTIPDTIVLVEGNHVVLNTPVTEESVSKTISDLAKLLKNNSKSPIYLVLDTPGGSVLAGYRLYEFLKPYKNVHTVTINSYSMGALLVQLNPGKRLMTETGTLMYHRMSAGVGGGLKTEEIQGLLDFFRQLEQFAETKIAERTGINKDKLHEEFTAELYMNGSTALKRNFIDKIIVLKCSDKLIETKKKILIQPLPFFPPEEVEISACPLV